MVVSYSPQLMSSFLRFQILQNTLKTQDKSLSQAEKLRRNEKHLRLSLVLLAAIIGAEPTALLEPFSTKGPLSL